MTRQLKYVEAIREAINLCMEVDPNVYVIGEGVPDPKGIFGTTTGLQQKYGAERVLDMPLSEDGMTGMAIGSALTGLRPILTHQRVDFALLSMNQIVNNAAKWHYMFGGQTCVPLVIRMAIGMGWGQGAQHSQSLQAWFAHVPGLKVVMPVTPYDAKGLLISSIEDDNPVIFLEHRWLHNTFGDVPEGIYRVPLGQGRIARRGKDITIAATSYMVLESLRAAETLSEVGIEADVVDIRTLKPFDSAMIAESVQRTGRLLAVDADWKTGSFAGEIITSMVEMVWGSFKCPPRRITLPDSPTPTSAALSRYYYPRAVHIVSAVCEMMQIPKERVSLPHETFGIPLDVPDSSFTGPF